MTDYLSNLSARSLGRTEGIPLVRPRVPSLFEPQTAPDIFTAVESRATKDTDFGEEMKTRLSPDSAERSEQEELVQEIPYETPRTSEAELRKKAGRAQRSERVDPGIDGSDTGEEARGVDLPSQKDLMTAPRIARPSRSPVTNFQEPERRFAAPEGLETIRRQTRGEQDERRPGPSLKSVSVPARLEEGRRHRLNGPYEDRFRDGQPRPMEGERELAEQPGSPEAAAQPQPRFITPVSAQASLRSLEPIHVTWTAHGPGEDNNIPAPTIQVTIGRIEVRASPPAARVQPKSKEHEPLSLDQYLRGRKGGGR